MLLLYLLLSYVVQGLTLDPILLILLHSLQVKLLLLLELCILNLFSFTLIYGFNGLIEEVKSTKPKHAPDEFH